MKAKKPRLKAGSHGSRAKNIRKIPIVQPEARDEGPRLIPLGSHKQDEQHFRKILELADLLLKNPRP